MKKKNVRKKAIKKQNVEAEEIKSEEVKAEQLQTPRKNPLQAWDNLMFMRKRQGQPPLTEDK